MADNSELLNLTAVSVTRTQSRGEPRRRFRLSQDQRSERRQAKHDIRGIEDIVVELLRNARDAHAQRIFLATGRGDRRTSRSRRRHRPDALNDRISSRATSKLRRW
jgi:hypothetical protein